MRNIISLEKDKGTEGSLPYRLLLDNYVPVDYAQHARIIRLPRLEALLNTCSLWWNTLGFWFLLRLEKFLGNSGGQGRCREKKGRTDLLLFLFLIIFSSLLPDDSIHILSFFFVSGSLSDRLIWADLIELCLVAMSEMPAHRSAFRWPYCPVPVPAEELDKMGFTPYSSNVVNSANT